MSLTFGMGNVCVALGGLDIARDPLVDFSGINCQNYLP